MYLIILISVILLVRLFSLFGRRSGFEPEWAALEPVSPKNVTEAPCIDSALEAELAAVLPGFSGASFAKTCEELLYTILGAFRDAHLSTLKKYLSEAVYDAMAQDIEARENRHTRLELEVRGVGVRVERGSVLRAKARVWVRLTSEQMWATVNSDGTIFDNPARIFVPKVNLWTLERCTDQSERDWVVVELKEG